MKKNDIAVVILVVALSLMVSYFLGGALINSPESRSKQVEVVQPIEGEFVNLEDREYRVIFDNEAINPSLNINVGENETEQPFGEGQN